MSYYQVLHINKDATEEQIIQAYKKLSLQYHPQLSKYDKTTTMVNFHHISEAFEVLSDPIKKTIFDKYGINKLKDGYFVDGQLRGGYVYDGDPHRIFEHFLNINNSFKQLIFPDDSGSLFGHSFRAQNCPLKEEKQDLIVELECTLVELYNGCSKEIKYQRKIANRDGRTSKNIEATKKVLVSQGLPSDHLIRYPEEGNWYSQSYGDLVVKIVQKQHHNIRRDGNNLIYTVQVSLMNALDARSIDVKTLDNRIILVPVSSIIHPHTRLQVVNEGMPIYNSEKKGNLIVEFEIIFPNEIDEKLKPRLKELLQSSH